VPPWSGIMRHKNTLVLHQHSCKERIFGKSNSYLNEAALYLALPDLGKEGTL
jgi:hypothetical protein